MTGAPSPDLHATIARALALCERRLRESVDEPRAELGMTVIEGVVADVDDILGPVLEAFNAAAKEMGLPAQMRNHRAGAQAALSLVWADLMELDPDRMRRAYGSDDLPAAWPAVRRELIAAVERALLQPHRGAVAQVGVAVAGQARQHRAWPLGDDSGALGYISTARR